MVVGAIGERADIAVIGGGPGGYVAALRAADAGRDVVLVERDALGGTCLNVGCVPSKALIEVADVHHRARHTPGLIGHDTATVEMGTITSHLRSVADGFRKGVEGLLSDAGVRLMPGTAHFARRDRLSIEHEDRVAHLDFDHAVISTGSRPIELPGFPIGDHIVDSTGALALTSLPERILILGGGYIGVELGTAFAKLGAAVGIVEAESTILPDLSPLLRRPVERALKSLEVEFFTDVRAESATQDGLLLSDGRRLRCDQVVVAVGRRPNSDTCSLEVAGAELSDTGHVQVDEHLRAAPSVYAIGDLVHGPALAHRASADAERAIAHILGEPSIAPVAIPEVIFSDPEVLVVGTTLEQAEVENLNVSRFPHNANARARTLGATTGGTWLVSDNAGTVLGVHAVGPHVSELAGEAVLAVEAALTLTDLARSVHPHPTLSETLPEAAWLGLGSPLHIRR